MEVTRRGRLVRQLNLYSEECLELLRQALSVAMDDDQAAADDEENNANWDEPALVYDDRSSSDDDKGGTIDSMSEDEGNADEEESRANATLLSDKVAAMHVSNNKAPNDTATSTKSEADTPKSINDFSRRHETEIQRHVDTVSCVSLPLEAERSPPPRLDGLFEQRPCLQLSAALVRHKKNSRPKKAPMVQRALELGQAMVDERPVMVLMLRSGRFAGGVFVQQHCIAHRTCQRYTVRQGQGKAQSTQDAARKPKSMGAQLRRAGERALQQDVRDTLTMWQVHVTHAALILLACPKTMRKTFWHNIDKHDARICPVPLDLGRPTREAVCVIYAVMMTVCVREEECHDQLPFQSLPTEEKLASSGAAERAGVPDSVDKDPAIEVPLTNLHVAARDGALEQIKIYLQEDEVTEIVNVLAGDDLMTPLHFAAIASDPTAAADCVYHLLVHFHADPAVVDGRHRLPYFLATHQVVRDAFRRARASVGEDAWDWEAAKVPAALTEDDFAARRDKEAEKKRRKRQRQKERKVQDKTEQECEQMAQRHIAAEQKAAQNAARVRAGLAPKAAATNNATNVCDFCQKQCKGRQRSQMLHRLDYVYCTTACVNAHKRELIAAAAQARFSG